MKAIVNVMNRIEQLLPEEIEKRSFEIISEELDHMGVILPEDEEGHEKSVHTSAGLNIQKRLHFQKMQWQSQRN